MRLIKYYSQDQGMRAPFPNRMYNINKININVSTYELS